MSSSQDFTGMPGSGSVVENPVPIEKDSSGGKEFAVKPQLPSEGSATRARSSTETHGKIFSYYRFRQGSRVVEGSSECSGVLINGKVPVVLTAAHCGVLVDKNIKSTPRAYKMLFIPSMRLEGRPFGTFYSLRDGFVFKKGVGRDLQKGDASNDWAFLRIKGAKKLAKKVGSDGIVFNKKFKKASGVSLIGYPGSPSNGTGREKKICSAVLAIVDNTNPRPRPYISTCRAKDMPKGTSGGGWRFPSYRSSRVLSVTSYSAKVLLSTSSGKTTRNYMAGPQLKDLAKSHYLKASK